MSKHKHKYPAPEHPLAKVLAPYTARPAQQKSAQYIIILRSKADTKKGA